MLAAGIALLACGGGSDPTAQDDGAVIEEPAGDRRLTMRHAISPTEIEAGGETIGCYSWTPGNETPLYVNAVEFANLGAFHHSNWFIVPDSVYEGPDGHWNCDDREFNELSAAMSGTVLFAQSTQAWTERVQFTEGAVIRIPAHARIVADVHLLNLAPQERETAAWLDLEVIHPYDVQTVLSPVQLTYFDLQIPAMSEIRFRADCGPWSQENPWVIPEMSIHYVLPHFHGAGNYFDFRAGEADEVRVTVEGFDAEALGQVFDPPVEIPAGPQISLTCGYRNGLSQPLTWGIGINEMCVALLLVDARAVYSGVVAQTEGIVDAVGTIPVHSGVCHWLESAKGRAYATPTDEERASELTLPAGSPDPEATPEPPTCRDADASSAPAAAPTFDNVRRYVLEPWCSFSACHGEASAGGLALQGDDLAASLLAHAPAGPTELPFVEPGNAEGSWLYRSIARCDPGGGARSMPRNAPVLLEDDVVAIVRAWIDAGAPE